MSGSTSDSVLSGPAGQRRPPAPEGLVDVADLLVVSPAPCPPLAGTLLSSFGPRACWAPAARPSLGLRLAVGVFPLATDDGAHRCFAQWAQAEGLDALTVSLDPGGALIGPLAVPGRPGCGHCARQRMITACAVRPRPATSPGPGLAAALLRQAVDVVLARAEGWDRLLDHVLVADGAAGFTRHRVIPLGHCPVCRGAGAVPAPARPAPSWAPRPGQLLEDLAGWVDPVTGVIPALAVTPMGPAGGVPVLATATAAPIATSDGTLRPLAPGSGKAMTTSRAIVSAVAEAVERYSASSPRPDHVVWARPDELSGDVLDPRAFALYSETQYRRPGFPYPRFDPAVAHPWVLGRWLGRGTPVWVPAVMTLLRLPVRPEHVFCQGTSSGLAASTTITDAEIRATLEIIERDAFLTAWLTGAKATRVKVEGGMAAVVAALQGLGLDVEVGLLPSAGCATVAVAVAQGDGVEWPGATVGLGADLDAGRAVGAAVLELAQASSALGAIMRSGRWPVPGGPSEVRELIDHAAYYFPTAAAAALDRIWGDGPAVSPDRGGSQVPLAVGLERAGIRVAVVDVTAPDVATGPFRVARAISPDLQPLTYGYGLDRLPVARLAHGGPIDPELIHPIS